MPEAPFQLSKPSLAYAKLVATPSDTSWSQVYNAGNLFACVSLTIEGQSEEDISLPAIGKEILDTLQAEFFVLEKKDIASISDVIHKSIHHVKEPVTVDVSLGFFKDNTLYLFLVGRGRVIMKRQGKIGILLESNKNHKEIITASGYLHNDDTVVLETKQFADDINEEAMASALELPLPNDIAEALSPKMHENSDGGQAAIIVVYHGVSGGVIDEKEQPEDTDELPVSQPATLPPVHYEEHRRDEEEEEGEDEDEYEDEEEEEEDEEPRRKRSVSLPKLPSFAILSGLSSKLHFPAGVKLSHRRKLFLSIIIVLVCILVISIFFTKKKQSDEQQRELFAQVYEPAASKFEDGQGLETLNKDLSTKNYLEAKKMLTEGSSKFAPGSTEAKQIQELLAKIESELAVSSPVENAQVRPSKVADNSLLAVAKANRDGLGFTQDDKAVYYVTDEAIVSVSKSSGSKSDVVKNDNTWEDAVGIATYQGNFYVLDRKKGIIKFVAGGDGYGASSYFKDKPNMASAKALAIDSSVYILMQDGRILKYTSGSAESYRGPTLEKAISNPAKIVTDANTDNAYILDRGNSRIIKFAKEGTAHTEYTASVLRNAQDIDINEADKKIYVLADGKFFEIDLK